VDLTDNVQFAKPQVVFNSLFIYYSFLYNKKKRVYIYMCGICLEDVAGESHRIFACCGGQMVICDACFLRLAGRCPICRVMPEAGDGGDDEDEHFNVIAQLMGIADDIPQNGRVAFLGLVR
jgi:hypothetical protein